MPTIISKADGSAEYFKVEKLRRSLRRAGASVEEIADIIASVDKILYDGILTSEIYRFAFEELRLKQPEVATKYSLRRALFGLGPTGFPFEKFLGKLFAEEGYTTKTGITLSGKCAIHEIDIAAFKADHSFVAEAKFHARPGIKSDLQVAMYSYARFLDLKDSKICADDICGIKEFWLITNTKFTSAVEQYAPCVGIKLLSWSTPRNDTLHDRIARHKLYPITVLQSLNNSQIETLLARNVILCRDIQENPHILRHLHLAQRKLERVLSEVNEICLNSNK